MSMNNVFYRILVTLSLMLLTVNVQAANENDTINWAGCGITKKAFMAELAAG